MDSIFCKHPPRQTTIAGAFGCFVLRLAIFIRGVCILAAGCLTRRRRLPGSTPITSPSQRLHAPAIDESTGVGAFGGLPRPRRQADPLLVRRCVSHDDIFFFGIVACGLAAINKRLTAPSAIGMPANTGCAVDDIAAWSANASEAVVTGGNHIGSSGGYQQFRMCLMTELRQWYHTFRLNIFELERPIEPVARRNSCEAYLGQPMRQPEPDTCAIVACIVAVEAMHRFVYALHHGDGMQFSWSATEPDGLLGACKRQGIWTVGKGASVRKVLGKIKDRGGVPATNATSDPAFLSLNSWQEHWWDAGFGLSPERVAKLLDAGPCVGRLWACPWYDLFEAGGSDDAVVYRGCGRSQAARDESERLYPGEVGSHAVVCFAYRICCGGEMHVHVLDNHRKNGPRRWVDVEELDALYTLDVDCM